MSALLGLTLLASAGLSLDLAGDHMASLGEICGGDSAHCAWCYAAAGLGLAALTAFVAAARPSFLRSHCDGPPLFYLSAHADLPRLQAESGRTHRVRRVDRSS